MRLFQKLKRKGCICLLTAAAALLVVLVLVWNQFALEQAETLGSGIGKITGTVLGSWDGFTVGYGQGREAGIAAGLSAEDTEVDLRQTVLSAGKLQVLSSGVILRDNMTIGENDEYQGLYLVKGEAVFSVDLAQAEITYDEAGKKLEILLPRPESEFYLDQNSTQMLAEKQKFSLELSSGDGLEAYLNSMAKLQEESKKKIANYQTLEQRAIESAETQIRQLVQAVSVENVTIEITTKAGGAQ